jgi:hypothetical protein
MPSRTAPAKQKGVEHVIVHRGRNGVYVPIPVDLSHMAPYYAAQRHNADFQRAAELPQRRMFLRESALGRWYSMPPASTISARLGRARPIMKHPGAPALSVTDDIAEAEDLAHSDVPLPSDHARSDVPVLAALEEDAALPDVTMEDIAALSPAYTIRYRPTRRKGHGAGAQKTSKALGEQLVVLAEEDAKVPATRIVDLDAQSVLSDTEADYLMVDFMDQETMDEFLVAMGENSGWIVLDHDEAGFA